MKLVKHYSTEIVESSSCRIFRNRNRQIIVKMSRYGLPDGLGMLDATPVHRKNFMILSGLFQPACLGLPWIQDAKNKISED